MKITRTGRPSARRGGIGPAKSGDAFARQVGGRKAPPAAATSLSALGAVLAAQEVEEPRSKAQRAVERGHDVLDELQELRLGMIDGWITEDGLHRLAAVVDEARPKIDDAALAEALDDIELAKLQRGSS